MLDIENLNTIGSKINFSVKKSKENWKQLTKINANVPAVLKLYGKFSIHVLNEKSLGKALVDKSKKIAFMKMEMNKGEVNNIEKLTEPIPMVLVAPGKSEMGTVKKVNMLFSSLFGYPSEDIVDRNIKKIMPDVYAESHEGFMAQYLECKPKTPKIKKFSFPNPQSHTTS